MVRKMNRLKKKNTCLLIDGENISAKKANTILDIVKTQGVFYEGKVYGRQKDRHTKKWSAKAKECGLSDIRLSGKPSKNKVDNKIKKDARVMMDQHKNIDIVCLATDDSDYISLVKELRFSGKRVVGIGSKQAARLLRDSCNYFVEI